MPSVLIVDDDKFTRTVLETIFGQDKSFIELDLEVHTAPDGERGLALFRELRPDVVVVDLLMPKVDGFAVCREIRAAAAGQPTHLVVISGVYRDQGIAQRLRSEYDAAFFAKPYQLKEMTRKVATLLAGGPRQPTSDVVQLVPPSVASVSAGELAERPLPAVMLDLLETKATGRLLVRRGKVSKTIELMLGHPVAITSSLRDETLGQLLLAGGVISEAQHRQGLERAASAKQRIGEALIELGALTPEQLSMHLAGQLRHKLVSALRWPIGAWRFEPEGATDGPARPPAPRSGAIDVQQTLITGLRDSYNAVNLPEHVQAAEGCTLELNARGKALLPDVARHVAPRLADLWRDGITTSELVATGLPRVEALAALDVLLLCGAVLALPTGEGSRPGPANDSSPGVSVRDLSQHSQMARMPGRKPQPAADARAGTPGDEPAGTPGDEPASTPGDEPAGTPGGESGHDDLYEALFDDGSVMGPMPVGDQPVELGDEEGDGVPGHGRDADSGVIDVANMSLEARAPGSTIERETQRARRMLLAEFLRVQGLDHYGVLRVARDADETAISVAVVERRSKFSTDWYARFDLDRDYAKLEQIHAAFDAAFETLIDPAKRDAYDTGTADEVTGPSAPPLEAELAFGIAEELLGTGRYDEAIAKLEHAIASAPEDSTYVATLGWAHFVRGGKDGRAADVAREYLNRALVLNPDSAVAHGFKGIIGAEIGDDDAESRFHLELALDVDPARLDAIAALEKLWERASEDRPLERLYRRLIYRLAGRDHTLELLLWRKLAELYRTKLDDLDNARIAFESAARLAPNDVALQAALQDLASGTPDRFFERSEMLRGHWRRDPNNAGPGLELLRAAEQAARPDASFLAASALVARNQASPEAETLYARYRPRFVVRSQRVMDEELWNRLRHPDDSPELGALFEALADVAGAAMPLDLAELEVDPSMVVGEDLLPDGFVKVRAYVAHLLGVPVPPVFLRSDFGRQIHVGAVAPPILLAGDDALAAPERSELGFRLGRAMTYLFPGRAIGGSRPSRFLKHLVLAAWYSASPGARIDDPDGSIASLRVLIDQLPDVRRRYIHELVGRLTRRSRALNLSRWARSLARSADRMGLLLCGDLPAAIRFAQDSSGPRGAAELIDFAISSAHLGLRSTLGLSIDV